ncbi:hypothetical protein Btru_057999 [Bulinus truncatus]|nr:hypothetical protein Btru_057999 [Bulinus truncatus]
MAASSVASARPITNKPVHSCTYCGLVLSSANALLEHKRIHTGDRPFSCHICNKKFTQKAHLNIHKRTHTGEKPYACHICNKQFAQSSHLNSHKRIHTGEKPFVCGICHIGFTQKQRLDTHLKKHLEKPGQEIVVRQRLISRTSHIDPYSQDQPLPDNVKIRQTPSQDVSHLTSKCDTSSADNSCVLEAEVKSDISSVSIVKKEPCEDSNDDNVGEKNISDSEKSPRISPRSFSSEGLFLHPSGYVAYGGTADVGYGSAGDEMPDDSLEHNGKLGASQHSISLNSVSHRRKPSVVRKRCNESPARDSSARTCSAAELHGLNHAEIEMSETDTDKKEINGCHSPGQPLDVESCKAAASLIASTRSCGRKNIVTGDVKLFLSIPNGQHGTANEQKHSDSSLVRVNNRISLVNFTAKELVAHMMKRDDVHKCPFCCLIFQDAAMYHIHRNMHDKSDIRMCNMCGKLLQDNCLQPYWFQCYISHSSDGYL